MARVAPLKVPVLVLGEMGTGKELVARALHRFGERSGGPFAPVQCGAIPDAHRDRRGDPPGPQGAGGDREFPAGPLLPSRGRPPRDGAGAGRDPASAGSRDSPLNYRFNVVKGKVLIVLERGKLKAAFEVVTGSPAVDRRVGKDRLESHPRLAELALRHAGPGG